MKKYFICFFALAVLLVSCQNSQPLPPTQSEGEETLHSRWRTVPEEITPEIRRNTEIILAAIPPMEDDATALRIARFFYSISVTEIKEINVLGVNESGAFVMLVTDDLQDVYRLVISANGGIQEVLKEGVERPIWFAH